MTNSTNNKWAVVTGASDGIGRALVHELGAQGFNIVAVGRSEAKMAELVAEFKGASTLETYTMEFNTPGSASALAKLVGGKTVEIFSPTAGFGSSGDFVDLDIAKELEMIDVNCRAVVEQTQFFAKKFKAAGSGNIIMFSSILGMSGAATSATYSATKNFIQAFSEGLREELKPHGVNVLTVCPGLTNTGFAQASQMNFGSADTPIDVARGIVNALGSTKTLYPTSRATVLGVMLSLVSRNMRVGMLSKVMRGMQSNH